jgi:hypothetical protein
MSIRSQNVDLCYQQPAVFWKILREIFFNVKVLFVKNLTSNYNKNNILWHIDQLLGNNRD